MTPRRSTIGTSGGRSVSPLLLAVTLATGAALRPGAAAAQAFTSGSTGVDGALDLTGTAPGTVIDFRSDMFAPPRDVDGDNVYHFTTITIPNGVTVRLTARYLTGPVYWLATGEVNIAGIVDLNGQTGSDDRIPTVPGAGGFAGGITGTQNSTTPPYAGSGPGGGRTGYCPNGCYSSASGTFTGNVFLVPLVGGSGGGGGFAMGGAGGGAILIASSSSIDVTGTITTDGGGRSGGSPGSGPGSGGAIRLAAPTITGTGTLSAAGTGSPGRIRLEAFNQSFAGNANPAPILRTPYKTFVPTGPPPSVRVVSVGGVPVASTPSGSFQTPDAAISSLATTPVAIETRSIPPGTVVNLLLTSEDGTDVATTTTPLAGTLDRATASAGVVFPTGFSRVFVRATWAPQ